MSLILAAATRALKQLEGVRTNAIFSKEKVEMNS